MKRFDGFMFGANLGGWLSQYDDDSKEHFDTFITEEDIEKIKKAGFDHVRVPVDYVIIETEDGAPIDEGYEYIANCIKWCRNNGLNMVLDLHKCYGYSFDPLDTGASKEKFFYDKDLQERFYKTWETIAERFSGDADMLAFELLNEVVSPKVVEEWNEISRKCSLAIRKYAPVSYIIIGGVCYNSVTSVPLLGKPIDDKIVYNFHCYEPFIFTHQRAFWVENMPKDLVVEYPGSLDEYRDKSRELSPDLADAINRGEITEIGPSYFERIFVPAVETAERENVNLYCGEYGVIELADTESAKRWFKDIHSVFDKYHIGHAVWNYKEKDFGDTVQKCFF
ncbi:glycoside hydrolase family 5 protein [Butyrivibrio sp. MC2021]|uniref:glycoside hydrolase family 5 protein n=1 Tax=Butyrivibrio sp. MC2021 TaxID=1408306 RepID=UPI00047BF4C3|nr:cellulase family glycosylhydrolase [Butyrivibrio sp. MC2021]